MSRASRANDKRNEARPARVPDKAPAHSSPVSASDAPAPTPDAASRNALRVICVDDHTVLVESLKAYFEIDGAIEVVGRLPSAARLVPEVARLRPDAVIVDIEMPGPDAFEVADRLRRTNPGVRVIVLSAHIRDAFISAAFRAGVSAYFAKSDDLKDIIQGIYDVVRTGPGSFVLGPQVRERCRPLPERSGHGRRAVASTDLQSTAPVTLTERLTPRELEILRLIGKGMSRTQIAAQNCRSAKTIDAHQGRMMKKLGIATRADLIRFAIREGLALA
jgi:DNA-binding NarL/FixJ family response regulator